MNTKRILATVAMALSASFASAAQLVIPASGSALGANGSRWQTEVTLHNAGSDPVTATLGFHDASGRVSSFETTIPAKSTQSFSDIVTTKFGKTQATGAIVIDVSEVSLPKLAVTSRTFNVSNDGEYGQSIPAFKREEALATGDTGVITGPTNSLKTRLNFGVYAVEASTIEWQLVRSNGSVVKSIEVAYEAGRQNQYNGGVSAFLVSFADNNDVIHARVKSGRAFVYGSAIDNKTNDPSFIPGLRVRENLDVTLLGIDLDENGSVDIRDENHDGTLDQPVIVSVGYFPNFFKVVVSDPEGKTVTLSLTEPRNDARLIDDNRTIQWVPSLNLKGTQTTITLRATDGFTTTEFIVPVKFE